MLDDNKVSEIVQVAFSRANQFNDTCKKHGDDPLLVISRHMVTYLNELLEEKRLTDKQAERLLITFIINQIVSGEQCLKHYLEENGMRDDIRGDDNEFN